jgi:hypothetical protein
LLFFQWKNGKQLRKRLLVALVGLREKDFVASPIAPGLPSKASPTDGVGDVLALRPHVKTV